MGLGSKFMLMILVPTVIIIGFSVTFSIISGNLKPFDILSKIELFTNNYLLIGVFILLAIIFFGFFLYLKEKFMLTS